MTVLVAYRSKKDKKLYLAADTQITKGLSKKTGHNKIITYNKSSTYVAVSGSMSIYRVLLGWCPPYMETKMNKDTIIDFVNTTMVPNLMDWLEQNKVAVIDKNVIWADQQLFLIHKGFCFEIGCDGSCLLINDFSCLGCGEEYAVGYLEAVHKNDSPDKEKVIGAIRCAGKYSTGCDQNVNIVSIDI